MTNNSQWTRSASCRLCDAPLFDTPLLTLARAPAGAQLFTPPGPGSAVAVTQLAVMQCRGCGLVQLSSDPVPYYRSTITAAGLSEEMRVFRLRQFRTLLEEFSLAGKLVAEIGAAKGLFTDLLAEAGAEAIGIEGGLAEKTADTPRGRRLYRAYPELLQPLPASPYAGLICINFLEHAPRPADFLRSIAASVELGAAGLIEVPAFEHMVEADLSFDWVADHLSYFSRDTLETALRICGFEVVRLERVWHGYDWAATVVRSRPAELTYMSRSLNDCVRKLEQFVATRNKQGRSVAIWGASHQALTLLTLCAFAVRDVPFIIDSAPFKQGTLAPGCGLPVVAPEALMGSGVDCVLVVAGGYSHEIGRRLRGDLGFRGEVAIYSGSQEPEPVGC